MWLLYEMQRILHPTLDPVFHAMRIAERGGLTGGLRHDLLLSFARNSHWRQLSMHSRRRDERVHAWKPIRAADCANQGSNSIECIPQS